MTFTNRYRFSLNAGGEPFKFSRFGGFDFIDDEKVRECVSDWKFEGFEEGTSFIVEITWQNMVGWLPMKIRSKGYSEIVKPPGRETTEDTEDTEQVQPSSQGVRLRGPVPLASF